MKETGTFDAAFFKLLKEAEKNHFWFQVRRRWIFDRINTFVPPPAEILEVGCGTGNVSSFLSQKGYHVTGCEFHREAINMMWPGFTAVQGDATRLPFENNSFDIVGLFDVIEHFEDDLMPLKEAVRVARAKSIVVVTVPARAELWSSADEMSFHKRRYTKEMVRNVLVQSALSPLVLEYMFMSLYLPMKVFRRKEVKGKDHFQINRFLNGLLKGLFNTERLFSKKVPLPLGTSIIAVARKTAHSQ